METTANLSVFLVDDDKMFLTSMAHQLKQMFIYNPNIKTFQSGEECLRNMESKPNLVILDYYLNSVNPDAMNGMQVLKKIKQVSPESTVIMLSGQDKMEVAIDTMTHGAYDYVVKNENVFLRTKNAIINAAHSISLSREVKDYKFWMRVFFATIIVVVAVVIDLLIHNPRIFIP